MGKSREILGIQGKSKNSGEIKRNLEEIRRNLVEIINEYAGADNLVTYLTHVVVGSRQ